VSFLPDIAPSGDQSDCDINVFGARTSVIAHGKSSISARLKFSWNFPAV
jgi:hypothetical protein